MELQSPLPHPTPIAELRCQNTLSSRLSVQTGKPRPMSDSPKVNAKTALQVSHLLLLLTPVVVHHAFQTGFLPEGQQ